MIDRTKAGGENGERSSGAVKRLETVSQKSRPHGKKFKIPFGTGPFLEKADGQMPMGGQRDSSIGRIRGWGVKWRL